MKPIIKILLLLSLLLLAGCGGGSKNVVTPTPGPQPEEPKPDPEPGNEPATPSVPASLIRLEFSAAALDEKAQIIRPVLSDESIMLLNRRFNRFEAEGEHYLSLTIELLNQGCEGCSANTKVPELSLLAVTSPTNLAATAFGSVKASDGTVLDNARAVQIAQNLRPIHAMTLGDQGLRVIADEASFQAYSETSLEVFKAQLAGAYRLLPYGFSPAKKGTAPNSLGFLTLAFKLPKALADTPPIFSISLMATLQNHKQVTESLEEQGFGDAAKRAEAQNASLTVLGDSPSRAASRLCSVALSRANQPVYLLNQDSCRPIDTVDSFIDEQDGNMTKGQLSLREALARAYDGILIRFTDEVVNHKEGIVLDPALGPLELNTSLVLEASKQLIIDGQNAMPLAKLGSGLTLELKNLSFQNGKSSASGAAFSIPQGTTLKLTGAEFAYNLAAEDGGAVFNEGRLELNQTVFLGNVSLEDGGALANLGSVNASGVYFLENKATGAGGAVFNASDASNRFMNTQFSQNKADYGGAVFHRFGKLELSYTSIYANEAVRDGGGLYLNSSGSSFALHASLIAHNLDAAQKLYQDVFVSGGNNPFDSSYCLIGLVDNQGFLALDLASSKNLVGPSLSQYFEPELSWTPVSGKLNSLIPESESPLLNAIPQGTLGCGSSLKQDITGTARPVGAACDMGAYEAK